MRESTKRGSDVNPPFIWEVARYCLDLPGGMVRHFPAGTYNEQVATEMGRIELELMSVAHRAWYIFGYLSLGQWGADEQRFVAWMRQEPEPEPSRMFDRLIRQIWQIES